MKTILRSLTALLVVIFLFSCEKNKQPGKGSLDFQYSASLKSAAVDSANCMPGDSGITKPYPIPGDSFIIKPIPMPPIYINKVYAVLVTISDLSGKAVLEKFEIPLYDLSGQYISKQIGLDEGQYKLTEFLVISNDRKVIYATPKSGSPKAGMVKRPLPICFTIAADIITHIVPEVISLDGISASDLGYATFGFVIVGGGTTDTTIVPPPPPGMGFLFGQPFKLMQGMIIPCASEIMKIQFVSFKDSRCPKNVSCVWAGEAIVYLNIYTNTGAYEKVEVKLGIPATAGTYTIKLVDLLPPPAEVSIPEKTAILVVNKGPEIIPMMK